MLKILYSEDARADIKEIWFYIRDDNPTAADNFISYVFEQCQLIAANPDMGISKPEIKKRLERDVRFFPVKRYGKYLIFYIIDEEQEEIEILRVLSGYRDILEQF
jgi:toxin ParE1/3/4